MSRAYYTAWREGRRWRPIIQVPDRDGVHRRGLERLRAASIIAELLPTSPRAKHGQYIDDEDDVKEMGTFYGWQGEHVLGQYLGPHSSGFA